MTETRAVSAAFTVALTFAIACAEQPDQASQQPPVNAAPPTLPAGDSSMAAAPPPPSPNKGPDGKAAMVGKVVVSLDLLTIASPAGPITIQGPLRDELKTLAGAMVGLRGNRAADRSFNVTSYEVLSIDGQTPFVGTVLISGPVTRLATSTDTLTLQNPPKQLTAGGKYWIVGTRQGAALHVSSYGMIRR